MKCPHALNQFCPGERFLSVFCSYKQSCVDSLYIHIFCSCLRFSVRSISGSLVFPHGRGGPAVPPRLHLGASGPPFPRHLPSSSVAFPFSLSCHLCSGVLGLLLSPHPAAELREVPTWSVTCSPEDRAPVTLAHCTLATESCRSRSHEDAHGKESRIPVSDAH